MSIDYDLIIVLCAVWLLIIKLCCSKRGGDDES
jgi:hypothetical protein